MIEYLYGIETSILNSAFVKKLPPVLVHPILHFIAGMGIALVAFGGLRMFVNASLSIIAAGICAIVGGVVKEQKDREIKGGDPSVLQAVCTGLGGVLVAIVLWVM